jgi:micrococcal nuclease
VIKGKSRDKFSISPEIAFRDKTICVTGVISNYNGKPEIVVTDPEQIKVK